MNKLKKCNYDPELLDILMVPSRPLDKPKSEYVRLPTGEIKRDKNGKAVRKRLFKRKVKTEVK